MKAGPLNLKYRLLLVWAGSVAAALVLSGALFTTLLSDQHADRARGDLAQAFDRFRSSLAAQRKTMEQNLRFIAGQEEIVASIGMIDRYQDPEDYQPLIFDEEKRRLGERLSRLANATRLDLAAVFDSRPGLAGFCCTPGNQSGYTTYTRGREVVVSNPPGEENPRIDPDRQQPALLADLPVARLPEGAEIGLRLTGSSLVLYGRAPLQRSLPGGGERTVGMLVTAQPIEEALARGILRQTGMEMAVIGSGGQRVGSLEEAGRAPDPDGLPTLEDGGFLWQPSRDSYLGAARLALGEASATVVIGRPKAPYLKEFATLRNTILAIVGLVALLILPLGAFFLNRVLFRPLDGLLSGVEAVGRGEFPRLNGTARRDELGRLAGAFNTMAETLQDREAALSASEERYRRLVEYSPIPILVHSDERVVFANPAASDALGAEPAQLMGRSIWEMVDPTDHATVRDRVGAAYQGRPLEQSVEVRLRRNDGAPLDALIKASAIEYQGRPAAQVVFSDITERKRAEQALREQEERVRLLLESTAEAIYGLDTEGRCTFVNPACIRLLGYDSADDLLGRRLHEVVRPGSEDASRCRAYQALQTGKKVHADDESFTRRDGTSFPVEYWSHPVWHQDELVGSVVTFFDISERRRNEERLRQAATVFESTKEGVMITDPGGRILAVNRAFTDITGYTEAEALGQSPRLLRSGRHDETFYASMWRSINETGHWQGELWNRRKNGEVFPEWLTISTVYDEEGRVTHFVGVFADISQIKRSEERLEHLAHYDPLTDLPNRLLLISRVAHALERARRSGSRVGILFLDLDRFKNVNDSLGHPHGDELLQALARRLAGRLRAEDTLARLGGDEFIILLEQLEDPQDAAAVARETLEALYAPFRLGDGPEIYITASIGISLYPDDGNDPNELVRNADAAMYQAKEGGRGTYRFYTEALTQQANERLSLETELRRALERDELRLHYQPQVAIADGRILGVEALVRWQHPEKGLLSPGQFIDVAEETGLIAPIGDWVLRTACAQARAWQDAGLPPLTVAVNLSTRQFLYRDVTDRVRQALAETGLESRFLELELTESALLERGLDATVTLEQLKLLGVTLAIDDFGTGYSSLSYLKRLPIDKLKIDRTFVRDIPDDVNDMEITTAVIAMAHNLRLKVLAEGVETEDQLRFLTEQDCDSYQGFYYARPLPPDDLIRLLDPQEVEQTPGRGSA